MSHQRDYFLNETCPIANIKDGSLVSAMLLKEISIAAKGVINICVTTNQVTDGVVMVIGVCIPHT